jgi:hypothetical protein
MDRVLLWEMSQIRRRDLLELAGAVRPREGDRPRGSVAGRGSMFREGRHALLGWFAASRPQRGAAPSPQS